jgi:hypothetical protein
MDSSEFLDYLTLTVAAVDDDGSFDQDAHQAAETNPNEVCDSCFPLSIDLFF